MTRHDATIPVRRAVRPFLDRASWRSIGLLTAASAVSGFAEAGALVVLTGIAVGVSRSSAQVDLGPLDLTMRSAILLCAGLLVVSFLLSTLTAWLGARLAASTYERLTRRMLDAFFGASWAETSQERLGDLQQLLTVNGQRVATLMTSLSQAIVSSLNLVVLVGVSLALYPLAVAGVVATGGVLMFLLRPFNRLSRTYGGRQAEMGRQFATSVTELSRLVRDIRVFDVEEPVRDQLGEDSRATADIIRRGRFVGLVTPGIYHTLVFTVALAFLGVASAVGGSQVGTLGAVVLLLLRALTYGQALQVVQQQLTESVPFLLALDERLALYEAARVERGGDPIGPIETLALRDVSFAYVPGQWALRHVRAEIAGGEAIGIVGPSGSGKSTLLQLLLRLREPTDGSLEANGRPATAYSLASWYSRTAFVPQEPLLIAGTVADNVRFFRPIDHETVEWACRVAQLHDEVAGWPNGYRTSVGEGGGALSGGQRQRLCIARAVAGRPDVLVLDEPTSALDPHSEAHIQQALQDLHGKVTLIIVAHRMTTISRCDRILVIEGGEFRALDTFANLAGRNAYFDEAVRLSTIPS